MARVTIPTLPQSSMTLSQVMGQCLRYLVGVQGYSPGTSEQYDRAYRQFLAHLRAKGLPDDIRSFTSEHIMSFAGDLGQRGVSPNTIICRLSALSTFADYVRKLSDSRGRPMLRDGNPTKAFAWPDPVKTETKFLRPAELRDFLDVERPLNESVARDLLLDAAIRVTEACEANVEDLVELDDKHFLTCRVKGRKRRGEARHPYPLSAPMAEALRDYLLARGMPPGQEPLLVNRRGRRWTRSGLTQLMGRIGAKAGVTRFRVSAHKLKHTANVVARTAGLDRYTRSQLLAHGNDKTLDRYEHLLPDELYEARQRQEKALRRYIGRPPRSD